MATDEAGSGRRHLLRPQQSDVGAGKVTNTFLRTTLDNINVKRVEKEYGVTFQVQHRRMFESPVIVSRRPFNVEIRAGKMDA